MDNALEGKAVLITGATAGIGLEAARLFAKAGAFVIGVGRSPERCERSARQIQEAYPGAQVLYVVSDLSQQSEVRCLAGEVRGALDSCGRQSLDILINNAGIYSEKRVITPDGVELTFAVNHLAPFLLTAALFPYLAAAPSGRVLTVSSGSHYSTWLDLRTVHRPPIYVGLWAYKTSKLANVLFSIELNRRAGGSVAAFALDPGLVNTAIGAKGSGRLLGWIWNLRRRAGVEPERPARALVQLARMPVALPVQEAYWRDSRPRLPSRQARRPDLASGLWELSSRLCGII